MPEWIRKMLGESGGVPSDAPVRNFKEDQQREAAYDSRVRGIRAVELDRIVGSVGRYQDFDSRFRLKHHRPSERLRRIKKAMRGGQVLPPVKLYQIKDAFYVLDGNHRIAAAMEMEHDEIRADVVEFIPSGNSLQDIIYRERADFADRTQLPREIRLTEMGQYAILLEQISQHQAFLEAHENQPWEFTAAADDWFRTVYRPLQTIIRRERLIEAFPERTLDDLCVYVADQQWQADRQRHYGDGVNRMIPEDMEAFRKQMAERKECEYPEMQRGITAFILMKVQAKREFKIVEKLFALDEVVEVHSVHGEVDLLVKIKLTRDLLSSDAEILSQFVHDHVRQLNGVSSTQTLIPGFSRVKG